MILRKNFSTDFNIKKIYNFNTNIYTQGLQLVNEKLYVSSGHYGKSFICILNLNNGEIEKEIDLEDNLFSEGLTYNGEDIVSLTWKENTGFIINPDTLSLKRSFSYKGDGWGICYNGEHYIMTDGSYYLYYIDTLDFKIIKKLPVKFNNKEISSLNELEFYDNYVYANVWKKKYILKINYDTGKVEKIYDLRELYKYCKKEYSKIDVLNGITHVKNNTFLVTGKNWPKIFLIELN